MMSNKVRYLLGTIMFMLAGLLIIPAVVKWDHYKPRFIEIIHSYTGTELTVKGKVKVEFLPIPKIILNDVYIRNIPGATKEYMVEHARLEGKVSPINLLLGKLRIDAVAIINAHLNLEITENDLHSWDFLFTKNNDFKIRQLALKNTDCAIIKKGNIVVTIAHSDIETLYNDGQIAIQGKMSPLKLEPILIDVTFKGRGANSKLVGNISSDSFVFTLNGKVSNENDNTMITGSSDFNIINMHEFADKYLSALNPLLGNINSQESVKIHSNFLFSNEEFSFKDLTIKSDSISGSGKICNFIDIKPIVDIDLKFEHINFDTLLAEHYDPGVSKEDIAEHLALRALARKNIDTQHEFNIPDYLDMFFYATVEEATYHQRQIDNIEVNTEIAGGVFILYPTTIVFADNTRLEMSGSAVSNSIRPKFEGTIDAHGTDLGHILSLLDYTDNKQMENRKFTLSSKVIITPKEVTLYDVDCIIDETAIEGLITVRLNNNMHIDAQLYVDSLDLDRYNVSTTIAELTNNFLHKQKSENPLSDLRWLRTLRSDTHINVNINKVKLNNINLENFTGGIKFGSGRIELDQIKVNSDFAKLSGEASLDIRALRPKLYLDVNGPLLDFDSIKAMLIGTQVAENKGKAPLETVGYNQAKQFIGNLMKIDEFDGKVKVNIDNFKYNSTEVKNINIDSQLVNHVLLLDKFMADVFGGQILLQGAIRFEPLMLNLSLSLANIKYSNSDVDGYFSASGSLNTHGAGVLDCLSNMDGSFSLAARQLTVNGFGIDQIVDSSVPKYGEEVNIDKLTQSVWSGSTLLDNVDGKFTITKGILSTTNLIFGTTRAKGAMSGSMDIRDLILSAAAQFAFIPTVNAQTLSINIKLSGPLNALQKGIDLQPLKDYLATKNALQKARGL